MKEASLRKIKAAIISAALVGGTAINEKQDKLPNVEAQRNINEESAEANVSIYSPLSFVENLGC